MSKYHFSHLENYTTFDSVEELNYHVNGFRDKTTQTEFKVLWFISKYAVKFIGAAHLKLSTIAEGISMSIKTVQRAIKSLVELEAINKVNTNKPIKGGQGANIYQIMPSYDLDVQASMSKREISETPCESKDESNNSEKQTAYSLISKDLKDFNTYKAPDTVVENYYSEPYRSVLETVYQFVNDKKIASKMYGIYLAQTKYIKDQYDKDTLLNTVVSAIRTSFISTKMKNIKSITGYFNGILSNKLDELYYQTVEEMWEEN